MAYRDTFWLLILKYIQLYFPVTIVCLCHISTAWSNDSSTKMFLLVFHKLKFLIVPRTLIRTTSVKDPIELGRYTKAGSEHCRPLIGQRESSLGRTWTFCTNLQSHLVHPFGWGYKSFIIQCCTSWHQLRAPPSLRGYYLQ